MTLRPFDVSTLNFDKGGGFVIVVAQDVRSRAVLMVARADREALERTIATGEMHYHSRTRGLWHKGATSGNVQRVVSLTIDCDGDAVLAFVEPDGPACHTGAVSCFDNDAPNAADAYAEPRSADILDRLASTIQRRATSLDAPNEKPSYTRRLLNDRNLRLKKLGEEAAELVVACADGDSARAAEEGADLLYHALVSLASIGVSLDDVRAVLSKREGR